MITVKIQTAPFNSAEEDAHLQSTLTDVGASVCFKGMVRQNDHKQPITHLWLEHFPQLTEQEIQRIIQQAFQRWPLNHCTVIHRVGHINVGEEIVMLLVTAKHRKEAFQAAEFIMDYLKTEAPFWKQEHFKDGTSHWVDAKQTDTQQKQRWI